MGHRDKLAQETTHKYQHNGIHINDGRQQLCMYCSGPPINTMQSSAWCGTAPTQRSTAARNSHDKHTFACYRCYQRICAPYLLPETQSSRNIGAVSLFSHHPQNKKQSSTPVEIHGQTATTSYNARRQTRHACTQLMCFRMRHRAP